MDKDTIRYVEFDNKKGTEEYFDWMRKNQNGFVLHPERNRKTNDYIFHKPLCNHIADESPKFSYKDKPKVCSIYLNGIKDWFNAQNIPVNRTIRACESCMRKLKDMPAYLS